MPYTVLIRLDQAVLIPEPTFQPLFVIGLILVAAFVLLRRRRFRPSELVTCPCAETCLEGYQAWKPFGGTNPSRPRGP
jgi:hypothetical protein